jgi:hypothetical protein
MAVSSEVGVVGLMAGVAEHAARVFSRMDLWEVLGFRGVLFMAAAAEAGHIGEFGLERGRVIGLGMSGLRTVAGFARYVGVTPGSADFGLIFVTEDAGVLPGIGDGTRADQIEGGGPVVAVFTEAFRDDGGADDEEESKDGEENQGRADEVPGVTHDTFQTQAPFLASVWVIRGMSGNMMTKRP